MLQRSHTHWSTLTLIGRIHGDHLARIQWRIHGEHLAMLGYYGGYMESILLGYNGGDLPIPPMQTKSGFEDWSTFRRLN